MGYKAKNSDRHKKRVIKGLGDSSVVTLYPTKCPWCGDKFRVFPKGSGGFCRISCEISRDRQLEEDLK